MNEIAAMKRRKRRDVFDLIRKKSCTPVVKREGRKIVFVIDLLPIEVFEQVDKKTP